MRLTRDHQPGAYAVRVPCYECYQMTLLSDTVIDLDARPIYRVVLSSWVP
mgnify:CR=1 FL=1